MTLTRRSLARLAAGAAVAARAGLALPQSPQTPVQPPTRDFFAEAVASHREDADAIARVQLDMSVEPAFEFRP